MRTLLDASAFALALLAGLSQPVLSQTTPSISLITPPAGALVDSGFTVVVQVSGPYEISQVNATVASVSKSLAATTYCDQPYHCFPVWSGYVDISSLTRGPYSLVFTATDALGNSGSLTSSIFYDRSPAVEVAAPARLDVARPEIGLNATCIDDDPAGCVSLIASVDGTVLASGSAGIDTIISLSAYDGLQKNLTVVGTDSAGRHTTVFIPIFVESSSFLQEEAKVAGEIDDVDATRISHIDHDTATLYIRTRGSVTDTMVYSGDLIYPVSSFLTESGVAFTAAHSGLGYYSVKSFESGNVIDLGVLNSDIKATGRYLMWTNGPGGFVGLFRRDVVSGSTITVASGVGNTENDVAANGTVSFWNNSYDIGLYKPDGTTTFLTADSDSMFWNIYPRTDGNGVVYMKTTPCCSTEATGLFLQRAGTTTELVPSQSRYSLRYRIANGWVAFGKNGPSGVSQVWRMDPANTQTQLTFASTGSFFEELGDGGSVTYTNGTRRSLVLPSSSAGIEIGSSLGKTFFVADVPYIAIGKTLFAVVLSALRPNPTTLFFAGQPVGSTSASRLLTLTNTGNTSVNVSSLTASANFTITSNDCGIVPPAGSCSVGVTFSPVAKGAVTGMLTIISQLGTQTVQLSGVGTEPPRLFNVSTRGQVLTGNDVMIAGFVIGGSVSKTIVVTVAGPSLANFGIANPLANPTLTLVRSSDNAVIAINDDWQSAANAPQIQASGFAPSNALEPAIMMTLPPGAYTAIVQGAGGGIGVGLVGVFEVDHPEVPLINISTRGQVLSGNDVMIAGFVIQGGSSQTVVINVAGPSLANFGIANPLPNPMLTLVRSSDNAVVATNDDWQSAANAAQIQASGFAPNNPLEPAIMVTLAPGAYTAIVQGAARGGTGVALVGVFAAP